MKWLDGDGSVFKRLMIQLSKKVPVMTDEYLTTKACAVYKNYDLKMKCP